MVLLVAFAGCAAFRPGDYWVGRLEADLTRSLGPANWIRPDGVGGRFLVYYTGGGVDGVGGAGSGRSMAYEEEFHVNGEGVVDRFTCRQVTPHVTIEGGMPRHTFDR